MKKRAFGGLWIRFSRCGSKGRQRRRCSGSPSLSNPPLGKDPEVHEDGHTEVVVEGHGAVEDADDDQPIAQKKQEMKTPKSKNLKEERKFWDTHDSADYLEDFEPAKDVAFVRPRKEVISLRLEPKIIRRLRELADEEGLPPTAYARMLILKGIRSQTAK
jgi:hypothetical protein